MKNRKFLILLFLSISTLSFCQNDSILKSINEDVWIPFTKAFETKNIDLFKSIHHKDLIRVAANNEDIKSLDEYMQGYQGNWAMTNRKQTIHFRFFERINNENKASERGIYKFTIDPGTESEVSYYGKFHCILIKNEGKWKLLLDYDSNENQTVNETIYQEAYVLEDFTNF